jgi:hypothetical protein
MALTIGEQLGRLAWHRYRGWGENLIEPISNRPMNTTPGHPLDRYDLLVSEAKKSHLPIAMLTSWDFIYLLNYGPGLVPRLYYINMSEKDFVYRCFRDFRSWCPVKYNPQLTYDEFSRRSPAFLIYGLYRDAEMDELSRITQAGRVIKWLKVSDGHFLAEVGTKMTAQLGESIPSEPKQVSAKSSGLGHILALALSQ